MAYFFSIIIIFSVISSFFNQNTYNFTNSVLSSGAHAAEYMMTAGASIIVFSGIMNVARKAGICRVLSRILKPVLRLLFGSLPDDIADDITMNIACNLLGLGNAATPYGVSAMQKMAHGSVADDRMIMFAVINTSSIQLLPMSAAVIRSSAGCKTPFDVLPCVWLCSVISLTTAVLCCKICKGGSHAFSKLRTAAAVRRDNGHGADTRSKRF